MRITEKPVHTEAKTTSALHHCLVPPTANDRRPIVARKEGGYIPRGRMILRSGCAFFKRSRMEIISRSRREPLSHERHVCMFLLMKDTTLTSGSIGRMFGRYRSTVLYAVKKIEHALETDAKLQRTVAQIRSHYQ